MCREERFHHTAEHFLIYSVSFGPRKVVEMPNLNVSWSVTKKKKKTTLISTYQIATLCRYAKQLWPHNDYKLYSVFLGCIRFNISEVIYQLIVWLGSK